MSDGLLELTESVLVVIDLQPSFMTGVVDRERVLARSKFLIASASALGVPIIATTQYATRMGGVDPSLVEVLAPAEPFIDKMSFSCAGSDHFLRSLERTDRTQVVLCGIESHICVCQTAIDLLGLEYEVYLAADAISARTQEAHDIAMRRISDSAGWITHSESCVYEWMRTAEHPQFRQVLGLVKEASV
ncbi:MAG: isochorismatase family protein [Fimbriimonadaceae bacterium]|nr:isochorismatase family protein [Fimbriimonadaceae bacterium]